MSKKSNRKRGKKKLRPGSTRDAHQQRVRSESSSRAKDPEPQEQDPALMIGAETRAAEAVTTLWVLSTLATGASLLGTLIFALITPNIDLHITICRCVVARGERHRHIRSTSADRRAWCRGLLFRSMRDRLNTY